MATKRGRPTKGLTDVAINLTAPRELAEAVRSLADAEGVKVREIWRRAAAEYVARRTTPPKK